MPTLENEVDSALKKGWSRIAFEAKVMVGILYDVLRHPFTDSHIEVDHANRQVNIIPSAVYRQQRYARIAEQVTERVYDQTVADPSTREAFKERLKEILPKLDDL